MQIPPGGLGRVTPPDQLHVEKYRLAALGADAPTNTPVNLGIPWMSNFDNPKAKTIGGKTVYVIGIGDLGTERGGHAICAQPPSLTDTERNVRFYNQGQTPECVGYSVTRGQSLVKSGELFNPHWVYHAAQHVEGRLGQEGATVRAAFHVLLHKGIRPWGKPGEIETGIKAYRWATTADEVRATLGVPDDQDGVDLDQSWGAAPYPPHVRITDEALEWCLQNGGEAGCFCER